MRRPHTKWCRQLQASEASIVEAVQRAYAIVEPILRRGPTRSVAKQLLAYFVRQELLGAGLKVANTPTGNDDVPYLTISKIGVLRPKALTERGRPRNARTRAARAYHQGLELDHMPALPRIDLSYRLAPLTHEIRTLELIEWIDGSATVYTLPWNGATPRIDEALEFPLRTARVRPRQGVEPKVRRVADDGTNPR